MIQICVLPGPKAPKADGYWSFLNPILNDINKLSDNGLIVSSDNGNIICCKVHSLLISGDIPAVSSICSHRGHIYQYGCRICNVGGQHNSNNRGWYFPPFDNDNNNIFVRDILSYKNGDDVSFLNK